MPEPHADALDRAVQTLTALAGPDELAELAELRSRVRDRRLRVLITGEAKRGKSTLANRLVGTEVLPTGVVPVTAVTTTLRRQHDAEPNAIVVRFEDGHRERHPLNTLAAFVTERENPRNSKQVHDVEVLLASGPMDGLDVELVDTPGTGSVYEHNTAAARSALQGLDAAIFVLTADPPISAAERDLLAEISARAVHTMVFLNKADRLDPDELAEAVEFTAAVCQDATGRPMTIVPGSARAGSADPGYASFAAEFDSYLRSRARADADTALRGHLRRLVLNMLDAAMLTERSLELAGRQSLERVGLFREHIDAMSSRPSQFEDQGWAAVRGLRRALDRSAAELRGELTSECLRQLDSTSDLVPAGLAADELYLQARTDAIELIRAAVDRWREHEARELEAGLLKLCDQVIAEQERELTEIRAAAEDLLALTLHIPADARRLDEGRGFWYAFERPIGIEPPLASTVRRLAPGKTHRALARLRAELPELVDRQVGRARADLQQRLQESQRTTVAGLRTSHQQLLERLQRALQEADSLRATGGQEHVDLRAGLTERVARLRAVVDDLGRAPDLAGPVG